MAAVPGGLGPCEERGGRERSGPRKGRRVDKEGVLADSPKKMRVSVNERER
jgi:hypothetical protein